MFFRLLTLSILFGLAAVCVAQQSICKAVELPVGVISVTGESFRGLNAEDFNGHIQKKSLGVKSLVYDDGPRRILIVLDASKKLSNDSRRAEGEMIETLLAGSRPEDSFALIHARGPGRVVKFTTDRGAITQEIGASGISDGKEFGILDAVMAGIEHFGTPQSGDAIVVIAADTEGNHKANAKTVARALDEHHIRMFGLALGPVATKNSVAGGTMTSTTSQGLAWTTPGVGDIVYDTGDDHFFPLTVNSGGLVLGAMNMDPRRSYNMTDVNLVQRIRQQARSIAKMISTFYRIQLESPQLSHPENWSLNISETIQKQSGQMFVLYPHSLGACSGS